MTRVTGSTTATLALRGSILHYLDDPGDDGDASAFEFFEDGLLLVEDGYIVNLDHAQALMPRLPESVAVHDHSGSLLLPGFVDSHTHFVQTDIIASHGRRLLEWLEHYTFPAERRFGDAEHAAEVAGFFLDELLRNGTTSALVFATVHPESVEALFQAGLERGMRLSAGKVLMDRNCPPYLRDDPEQAYTQSKQLIGRWHGRGRLEYAISPRFAPTSSEAQLEAAGRLAAEHPEVLLQTHLAENEEEVAWVRELFGDSRSYLDVYDRYGLLRGNSVFAHAIWLDPVDRERIVQAGASLSHCPTCNLFMGSGLFDLQSCRTAGARVALGTDVGGGTTFSMLQVMHDAYKVAQLRGASLAAHRAFYLATLAGAQALGCAQRIGNFLPGREADIVVLDPAATPLLQRRSAAVENLEELLFLLMMLGDDRSVAQTYLMGRPAL